MSQQATTFRSLHEQAELLVLPNVWDVASARLFEDAGAKAIATTSAGVAWAQGYPDGNVLPTEKLVGLVKRITDVIKVPLSVDFEGGYSDEPAQVGKNIRRIIDAGAVGINIEDGEGTPELLEKKIEQIRKASEHAGVRLFINARTDVYLNDFGSAEENITETIVRALRYRAAGADGIFVPGVSEPEAIKSIASEIKLPLNVVAWPGLPQGSRLLELGVKRLSAGQTIAQLSWGAAVELATGFLKHGDSAELVQGRLGFGKFQSLFGN